MASEYETIADIVAMLRANARGERFDDFSFSSLADRIEAAWKREAVTNCNGLGNAAAMREALKRCEAISHFPEIREQQCVKDMRNIIAHALAAPPRNCDLYKDAPSAYADFIVPWKLDGHMDDVPTLKDFADWLFAPVAERK